MQILLNIKNEKIFDKLLWMLEHFKSDGVEIKTLKDNQKEDVQEYDVDYERSFQYKLDRAEFIEMKENLWITYLIPILLLIFYLREEEKNILNL